MSIATECFADEGRPGSSEIDRDTLFSRTRPPYIIAYFHARKHAALGGCQQHVDLPVTRLHKMMPLARVGEAIRPTSKLAWLRVFVPS